VKNIFKNFQYSTSKKSFAEQVFVCFFLVICQATFVVLWDYALWLVGIIF